MVMCVFECVCVNSLNCITQLEKYPNLPKDSDGDEFILMIRDQWCATNSCQW